jgi:hypothetical protein
MTTTNLNLYQLKTTSWNEEDCILLTSLTEKEITDIIEPLILAEREDESGDILYTNQDYAYLLQKHYPQAVVVQYAIDGIDLITI